MENFSQCLTNQNAFNGHFIPYFVNISTSTKVHGAAKALSSRILLFNIVLSRFVKRLPKFHICTIWYYKIH